MKKAQSLSMNTIIIAALALVVLVVLVVLVINAVGDVESGKQCQAIGGSCVTATDAGVPGSTNPVEICNNWAKDRRYPSGTPLAGDCAGGTDLAPQFCCQTLGNQANN